MTANNDARRGREAVGPSGGYSYVFAHRVAVVVPADASDGGETGSVSPGVPEEAHRGAASPGESGNAAQQSAPSSVRQNGSISSIPCREYSGLERRDSQASQLDNMVEFLFEEGFMDSEPPTGLDHAEAVEAGLAGLQNALDEAARTVSS